MKIGILTDSTCDLSPDIITEYKLEIAPLNVKFGEKVYTDGVDLSTGEFFEKLEETADIPGTSCPPIGFFIEKYRQMASEYDTILSIHVSSGLSGTLDTARMAARQLPEIDIHFIDSASISLGLGFLVLLAARLNKRGETLQTILQTLGKARDKLQIFFTVGELKYMEKGGRIGKASALLGSVFNINPIIAIATETGKVQPLEKSRGKKRTMKKMARLTLKYLKDEKNAWLGFAHGDRLVDLEIFKEQLLNKIAEGKEINYRTFNARISPTLGVHVGPTVYAIAILAGDFLDF